MTSYLEIIEDGIYELYFKADDHPLLVTYLHVAGLNHIDSAMEAGEYWDYGVRVGAERLVDEVLVELAVQDEVRAHDYDSVVHLWSDHRQGDHVERIKKILEERSTHGA